MKYKPLEKIFLKSINFYGFFLKISPFKLSQTESLDKLKKKPFSLNGQWGDRKDKINDLIEKMI